MKNDSILIPDGELYFEVHGTGDPILFVHGFSLDHRIWQPQIEYFQNTNQAICYDLRGFGKSSLPTHHYSHHEDVKTLLDYLETGKVHLVGLSLGGEVAIDFSIVYPNQVKTLTLIDTSLGGYHSKVDWRVYAEELCIDQAKQNWLNHEVFKYSCSKPKIKKQLEQSIADYSGWHWLHHDFRTKLVPSAIDRLSEITVPTQIIVGQNDLDYYQSIAKVVHQQIHNSFLTVLPHIGHLANIENPQEINNLINKHFQKL